MHIAVADEGPLEGQSLVQFILCDEIGYQSGFEDHGKKMDKTIKVK